MENLYKTKIMKKYLKSNYQMGGYEFHNIEFPKHLLVCSGTGGGKSNFILNYLKLSSHGKGTIGHLTIVCKQMEELYEMLQDNYGDDITIHTSLSKLPPLREFKEHMGQQQMVIFDDCVAEKNQSQIEEYFLRARKHGAGVQCVYLSQSYFKTPIFIRNNVSYLVLLTLSSDADLSRILTNYGVGIDKDIFKKIFKNAVSEKLCAFKINIGTTDLNNKFSRNFMDYYKLMDEDGNMIQERDIILYRHTGLLN